MKKELLSKKEWQFRKMHTSFKNRFKDRGEIFAKEFINYLKNCKTDVRVHEEQDLLNNKEIIEVAEKAFRTFKEELGMRVGMNK